MKEFLVYGMEKNYPFKTSEIYTLDLRRLREQEIRKEYPCLLKIWIWI